MLWIRITIRFRLVPFIGLLVRNAIEEDFILEEYFIYSPVSLNLFVCEYCVCLRDIIDVSIVYLMKSFALCLFTYINVAGVVGAAGHEL